MTVNELLGLPADAGEAQIMDRIVGLSDTEGRLLKLTGKDNVGDAFGDVIANRDAAQRLVKTEAELREMQEAVAAEKHGQQSRVIKALVDDAAKHRRFACSDEEFRQSLTDYGEAFGTEKLRAHIGTYQIKVRAVQAPPPVNVERARDEAIAEYKRTHEGASTGDAMVALAAERPHLFPEYGGR